MEMINVWLAGQPVGKGRPRFARGRVYTPAKTKAYEERLAARALEEMESAGIETATGPVRIEARAIFTIPKSWPKSKKQAAMIGEVQHTGKPDADNVLKIVGDALNGIVWKDDSQIVSASINKRYGVQPALVLTAYIE